jgi:activating signal cointegrator complex subunit 1
VKSFRESVLTSADASSDAYRGVDESIFVKPATFHLTLLMLKLWNEERVCMAQDCLQRVMPDIHKALKGHPLAVKLAGVVIAFCFGDCMCDHMCIIFQ